MSEGAVADTITTPEPAPQATPDPSSGGLLGGADPTPASSNGEAWGDLPEDLRSHPVIQNTKDVPALAKRLVDSQTEIGKLQSNTIQPPDENWTDKDFAKLWNTLGRPENREDFNPEVKAPEGTPISEGLVSRAKDLLYDNGLAPWQAERVINGFLDAQGDDIMQMRGKVIEELKGNTEAIQQEWGEDFQPRLERAGRMNAKIMETLGLDEDALRGTVLAGGQKLGNTPAFVKIMDLWAEKMGEDTLKTGEETRKTMDVETAKLEAEKYANENIAILMDRAHPMHASVQDELLRLNTLAAGPNANEVVISIDK